MRGQPYLDWKGKSVLDIMAYARKLPKEQKRLYLDGVMAAMKAITEGRIDSVKKAIKVLRKPLRIKREV